MSFQQGLSGLSAASKNLDVIGNNIANVSTVGFKSSRAEFADIYAASLFGAGGAQIGIGSRIVDAAQQFTQGNITITNNPLDVAINGDGFFRLSDSGALSYSRNGQFHLDQDGFLVTNTGLNVTGYTSLTVDPLTNEVTGAGDLDNIQIQMSDLEPNPTTTLEAVLNLDAREDIIADPFLATDPSTYNYSTTATVFDSQGSAHSLSFFFTKTAANTWTVNSTIDVTGATVSLSTSTLTFNTDGSIATAPPTTTITTTGLAPTLDELNIAMDFTDGTTQFAGNSGVTSLIQDGFARGRVVGVNIDENGVISGRYSNGLSRPLQQILLATFRNQNAMLPLGDNQWAATGAAGAEVLNAPNNGISGSVQSGATEDSNVDLTADLVNMIVAQRLYQANAQTIQAQDQILQTLVNLT